MLDEKEKKYLVEKMNEIIEKHNLTKDTFFKLFDEIGTEFYFTKIFINVLLAWCCILSGTILAIIFKN